MEDELTRGLMCEEKIKDRLTLGGWLVFNTADSDARLVLSSLGYELTAPSPRGGPCVVMDGRRLSVPDLLCVRRGRLRWVEVKLKTSPSWHRNSRRWEHGIDLDDFNAYRDVQALTWEVWLAVHEEKSPATLDDARLREDAKTRVVSLTAVERLGRRSTSWPGSGGGQLWPVDIMEEIDIKGGGKVGGRRSRRKGADFERWVAGELREKLGIDVHRGIQSRSGGDAPDVDGDPRHWYECKCGAGPRISAAMDQGLKATDGRVVVVVSKKDREKPMVTMRMSDWLAMVKHAALGGYYEC